MCFYPHCSLREPRSVLLNRPCGFQFQAPQRASYFYQPLHNEHSGPAVLLSELAHPKVKPVDPSIFT